MATKVMVMGIMWLPRVLRDIVVSWFVAYCALCGVAVSAFILAVTGDSMVLLFSHIPVVGVAFPLLVMQSSYGAPT